MKTETGVREHQMRRCIFLGFLIIALSSEFLGCEKANGKIGILPPSSADKVTMVDSSTGKEIVLTPDIVKKISIVFSRAKGVTASWDYVADAHLNWYSGKNEIFEVSLFLQQGRALVGDPLDAQYAYMMGDKADLFVINPDLLSVLRTVYKGLRP